MIDSATLRTLIRDVIASELAAAKAGTASEHRSTGGDRIVSIASDADLNAFARRVLSMAADPDVRQAIATATCGFRLERGASGRHLRSTTGPPAGGSIFKVDKGVVTEAVLERLPKGVTGLQIAAGVSVTPLAKDRLRSLNLTIERIGK